MKEVEAVNFNDIQTKAKALSDELRLRTCNVGIVGLFDLVNPLDESTTTVCIVTTHIHW